MAIDGRRFVVVVLALILAALPVRSAADGQRASGDKPSLERVLDRAARYVSAFQQQLAGIVAEETYSQEARRVGIAKTRGVQRRRLKSDLLLVQPTNANRYVEFRDVFEVDGRAVRDRKERLTALFIKPTAETANQLKAIIEESARYNPGSIYRNINTPMLVLSFLSQDLQPRFRFSMSRRREPRRPAEVAADSAPLFRVSSEMWVLSFREVERPTVIRTTRGADFPATGRAWVDPETGAILMTELVMQNRDMLATITVSYQSETLLGFNVPVAMREGYSGRAEYIEAFATYGSFRKFQVKTSEIIGKPPGTR